jgi:hypothetical protein
MLEVESTRKKMKKLTGDIDIIEAYHLSLGDIVKQKLGGSKELDDSIRRLQGVIVDMRDIFSETSMNVS